MAIHTPNPHRQQRCGESTQARLFPSMSMEARGHFAHRARQRPSQSRYAGHPIEEALNIHDLSQASLQAARSTCIVLVIAVLYLPFVLPVPLLLVPPANR